MKHTFFFLLVFTFSQSQIHAQDYSYNLDLLELYLDGNYSKCLKKSLRHIKKKKNHDQVYPHFLIAQTYFDISRSMILEEEHPNALANAVAYARSYYEKCSGITIGTEEFYFELREYVIEVSMYALEDLDSADFESINNVLKDLAVYSPNSIEIPFIRASALLNLGKESEADAVLKQAEKILTDASRTFDLSTDELFRFEYSLLACVQFIEQKQSSDQAFYVLNLGKSLLSESHNYLDYYYSLED